MRKFSVRPALTFRGRKYKGLRGFAGKPFHPPLTDIPIGAYLIGAFFDVLSRFFRDSAIYRASYLNRAATYIFLTGAAVSVLAILTGWADWHRSSTPGTQARRTINTHAILMISTSVVVLADIALRLKQDDSFHHSSGKVAALSVLAALLASVGSMYGGALVYEYGFNVETAGDHPAWHRSETDVFPGQHDGDATS